MKAIEVELVSSELIRIFGEMREWLDSERIEPLIFEHRASGQTTVIRVVLRSDSDVELFLKRFGGRTA